MLQVDVCALNGMIMPPARPSASKPLQARAKTEDISTASTVRSVECANRLGDEAVCGVCTENQILQYCAEALNGAMERGVLIQRSMGPRLIIVIVGSIGADDPALVRFTEHDDVVQALPADRANESLNVSVLPG